MVATSDGEESVNAVVDISHWQESVDFKQLKENGIVGVIHKATEGLSYVDPKYSERRKAAEKEGLLWGAYHFGNGKDGKAQAEHFLKTVGSTSGVLLALDIEKNENGKNIASEQADDFVNRIAEATGRHPMIYGCPCFLKDFSTPTLTKCPLWIARYGPEPLLPNGWNEWVLWQYTDGKVGPKPHEVQGVGAVDRSKFNGSLEELKSFWKSW